MPPAPAQHSRIRLRLLWLAVALRDACALCALSSIALCAGACRLPGNKCDADAPRTHLAVEARKRRGEPDPGRRGRRRRRWIGVFCRFLAWNKAQRPSPTQPTATRPCGTKSSAAGVMWMTAVRTCATHRERSQCASSRMISRRRRRAPARRAGRRSCREPQIASAASPVPRGCRQACRTAPASPVSHQLSQKISRCASGLPHSALCASKRERSAAR